MWSGFECLRTNVRQNLDMVCMHSVIVKLICNGCCVVMSLAYTRTRVDWDLTGTIVEPYSQTEELK